MNSSAGKLLQSISLLVNDKEDTAGLHHVTDRELLFLRLACSEKTYREIAAEMFLSERTIDGYRESLFKKLHVTTRVGPGDVCHPQWSGTALSNYHLFIIKYLL